MGQFFNQKSHKTLYKALEVMVLRLMFVNLIFKVILFHGYDLTQVHVELNSISLLFRLRS